MMRIFTCPRCGTTTDPATFAGGMDAIERYCRTCQDWTGAGTHPHHYDFDGNPIPAADWALLFEARRDGISRWQIGKDTIADYEISTVWLGLDAGWNPDEPLIFETMVFGSDDDETQQERYSTKEDALVGHQRWVQWARERVELLRDATERCNGEARRT